MKRKNIIKIEKLLLKSIFLELPLSKKLQILLITLCLAFLNLAIFAQDTNNDIIKVNTALVNIPVIVSDRNGRNIAGLQVQNFAVFEDGKQQKIEYFVSEESPINVALLLDTSRSTQQVLGKIKSAAKEFLKQLQPTDKAMIVTFDNDVQILNELTSDRKTLEKAIKKAEIGESVGTVLHDAVYDVVNKKFANVKGRKAIIMLTDGKDFGSNVGKSDLLHQLEESDTLIYSIFYETGNVQRQQNRQNRFPDIFFPPNRRGGMGRQRPQQNPFPQNIPRPNQDRARQRNQMENEQAIEFLQKIADVTAGRLYQKKVADLDETFIQIADELRKQYLIGYYPEENSETKNVHQIRIKVDKSDVVVRAKNSYRVKTE